jgi:hypothetical protein
VKRWLGLALVSATLAVASPAQACACGGLVDGPGGDTSVSSERAVVVWDGRQETIVVRLSTRSDAVNAGLLIPTPAPATVTEGEDAAFTDLERLVAPVTQERRRLFGPPALLGGMGGGGEGSAGGLPGGGVDVLDSVQLGPLRATTLAAADGIALEGWLKQHHFLTSTAFQQSVQPYFDDGWSFVAVQLNAVGGPLTGDLPAIAMTFASTRAVYPMRMSAVAEETQQPVVYVLAAHRMERSDLVADGPTRPDLLFAGRIAPDQVVSPSLKGWLATTPYVTATSQWLPDPPQIVSDFTFRQASSDTAFQRVLYDDSYLIPADVAALVVLLLVTSAVWFAVRRLGRRRRVVADVTSA